MAWRGDDARNSDDDDVHGGDAWRKTHGVATVWLSDAAWCGDDVTCWQRMACRRGVATHGRSDAKIAQPHSPVAALSASQVAKR